MPTEVLRDYRPEDGPAQKWVVNEAYLVNEALDKGVISQNEAVRGLTTERSIADMMRRMIEVTYFVELPPEWCPPEERGERLMQLFQQRVVGPNGEPMELVDYLRDNRQSVSIAMSTLDEPTAKALRYLNYKGVPAVGWVVLSDEQGYWTNATNIAETKARAEEIKEWAKDNNVEFAAIGFDNEKPLEFIKAASKMNPLAIAKELRAYRRKVKETYGSFPPNVAMESMLQEIGSDGTEVELYEMPRFSKIALGGVLVRAALAGVKRNVEMTYTSDLPAADLLRRIGLAARLLTDSIPALGLVNGIEGETPGRDLTGKLPKHHTPETLENDIRSVMKKRVDVTNREFNLRNVYIFALNDRSVPLMVNDALKLAFSEYKQAA